LQRFCNCWQVHTLRTPPRKECIRQLPDAGLTLLNTFTKTTEAVVNRGFRRYAFRRGLWFWIRRKFAKPITLENAP
jgi:hypothetical protein